MDNMDRVRKEWNDIDALADLTKDDGEANAHAIGVRDGYEQAVQTIDMLTGGDAEYRYCTIPDEGHCPTPVEMIARIVERLKP